MEVWKLSLLKTNHCLSVVVASCYEHGGGGDGNGGGDDAQLGHAVAWPLLGLL